MIKIKDLKSGDKIWECESGFNIPILVLKDGWEDDGASKCDAMNMIDGRIFRLYTTNENSPYRPKLYKQPEYLGVKNEYDESYLEKLGWQTS